MEVVLGILGFAVLAILGFGCGLVGVCAGCIAGMGIAIANVFQAAGSGFHFREWSWPEQPEADPAVRSYFAGPGLGQLRTVVVGAFRSIGASTETLSDHQDSISIWGDGSELSVLVQVFAYCYMISGVAVSFITTVFVSFVMTVVLGAPFLAISALFVLFLSAARVSDALYLRICRIRADCPVHKGSYRIPAFRCSNPKCGRLHRRLLPNGFGILYHRCRCGTRLPCTFFNGRSGLQAYCPVPGCEAKMVASDARPVVFQLVGGSHAGKSVFLASAMHILRGQFKAADGLKLEIPEDYEEEFGQLERWFSGAEPCAKTTDVNARTYPLLVRPEKGTRRVLTFYDIAGERFSIDVRSGGSRQIQLGVCDALLFLLDPFSSGKLRQSREQDGVLPPAYSSDRAEDVLIGFVNYMIHLGLIKANGKCATPLYVLIAKADEPEVSALLSPDRIGRVVQSLSGEELPPTLTEVRDDMCREFLERNELQEVLNGLDYFETVHFYPVSAMGHADAPGKAYAPWGIAQLLRDLIAQADPELYRSQGRDPSGGGALEFLRRRHEN